MKKVFSLLIAVLSLCALLPPTSAYAQRYSVSGTDISVNIDDTEWYVFTRNNLYNNPELDELGVSFDYMSEFMLNNDIYLDAAYFYADSNESLELFVSKKYIEDIGVIGHLSKYSASEVEELAESLAEKLGSTEYSIYETQYKFIKMEYYKSGYYIMAYCTVVNGDNYTLTFQTTSPFIDWEYQEMDDIVDSVEFDVENNLINNENDSSVLDGLLEKFIGGTVIAAIFGGISLLIKKRP